MMCDNCNRSVSPPMFMIEELAKLGYEHHLCWGCSRIIAEGMGLIKAIIEKTKKEG